MDVPDRGRSQPFGDAQTSFDAAFVQEIELGHARLVTFAALLAASRPDAEDIVAEAYARVWASPRRHRIDDLTGYLRRSVANLAMDRHRRRRLERRETTSRRVDWRGFEGSDSRSAYTASGIDPTLREALQALPYDQRSVIVCRHVLDMSEVETATTLGLRLGTVKSRLARGLIALRLALSGHDLTGVDHV